MTYPAQKTRLVTYWDCGLGHSHKSEETAQRCIDKRKKPRLERVNNSDRDRSIFLAILDNETTYALAVKHSLTVGRIAQIFHMERRKLVARLSRNGMSRSEIYQKLGPEHRIYSCRPYFRSIRELYLKCEGGVNAGKS